MSNDKGYVSIALFCAQVCEAIGQEFEGREAEEINSNVLKAIEQLKK